MTWGGFYDFESNIKNYTLCVGTGAYMDDVVECERLGLDQSKLLTQVDMDVFGEDGNVYFTVYAENGEGAESAVWLGLDTTLRGPDVVDWAVKRAKDGMLTSQAVNKQGDPHSITFAIGTFPQTPDISDVAMVEVAIGLGPRSYQDAQEWTELPFPLQDTSGELWEYTLANLTLQHGVEYYIHIRATNDLGLQQVTTLPTTIFIDMTPAHGQVRPHNGASIMLEYLLEWLPLSAPDPVYSATYWMVGASWSFTDDERTEIAEFVVELHDAKYGHPDQPLRSQTVGPLVTSTLFQGLRLEHLSEYEVRVRARSVADVWGEATSSRVTIDLTRPTVLQVVDLAGPDLVDGILADQVSLKHKPVLLTPFGKRTLEVDFVTESMGGLRVGFGAWDPDSGIIQVLVAVGVAPGSTSLLPWTLVTLDTPRQITTPVQVTDLEIHTRYFVSITAVNVSAVVVLG